MSPVKDVASAITRLIDAKTKGAPTRVPEALPEQDDPVAVLVQSFLLWQSSTDKAAAAYEKIRRTFVDWNDLRVSMPDEVVAVIGVRYPEADERCRRLRAVLRNLYQREHEMSFASAEAAGKRSLRKYLESLEGMLPYVAERTLLVAFGGHGMPVDETLRLHLVDQKIADETMGDEEASSLLLKHVKAADALVSHLALQTWVEQAGPPKAGRTAPATTKKTSRRTSSSTSKKKTSSASSKTTTSKKTTKKTTKKTSKKTSTKSAGRKTTSKKEAAAPAPRKKSSKKTATKKTSTKKTSTKKTARSSSR